MKKRTCKWLATFSLVKPGTFMTSRIFFGTAPAHISNWQENHMNYLLKKKLINLKEKQIILCILRWCSYFPSQCNEQLARIYIEGNLSKPPLAFFWYHLLSLDFSLSLLNPSSFLGLLRLKTRPSVLRPLEIRLHGLWSLP